MPTTTPERAEIDVLLAQVERDLAAERAALVDIVTEVVAQFGPSRGALKASHDGWQHVVCVVTMR
jgi:hypothetical protein